MTITLDWTSTLPDDADAYEQELVRFESERVSRERKARRDNNWDVVSTLCWPIVGGRAVELSDKRVELLVTAEGPHQVAVSLEIVVKRPSEVRPELWHKYLATRFVGDTSGRGQFWAPRHRRHP